MKSRYFGLAALTLGLALAGCEKGTPNQQKPEVKEYQKLETKVVRTNSGRKGLAYYESARFHESQYYEGGDTVYALAAINNFEEYYSLVPKGVFAVLSLLRKAKLYHAIGQDENARDEIKRLKKRKNLKLDKFSEEIKYLEDLID